MNINIMENPSELNESEKTYRALENSIQKIQRFTHKLAKKSNPSLEVQAFWELGDSSLIHWISDTQCYLSRKGQKLQFLGRQSKLEIIGFHLEEGDKLLICGESIRQKISDIEIDDILQSSVGVKDSCLNILKIANVDTPYNVYNIHNVIVFEVVNKQKITTPTIDSDDNPFIKKSYDSILLLFILFGIIGVLVYFYNSNRTFDIAPLVHKLLHKQPDSTQKKQQTLDSLSFQSNTDSLQQIQNSNNDTSSLDNSFGQNSQSQEKEIETPLKVAVKNENKQNNWQPPTTTVKKKSASFELSKEEQNYNALRQQKEKWLKIKGDLQQKLNAGDLSVSDQLKNSEKVIARIEEKLMISAQKLDNQR
jgi:hypothetical protein